MSRYQLSLTKKQNLLALPCPDAEIIQVIFDLGIAYTRPGEGSLRNTDKAN